MLHEFGIFSNEGLIEGQFYSRDEAVEALSERYDEEGDGLKVLEICPEHEGQPKHGCEECDSDSELFVDEDFFDGEDEE